MTPEIDSAATPLDDFEVRKLYFYSGPNFYLGCRSFVFNLYIDPEGRLVDHYVPEVVAVFPQLEAQHFPRVADLFAAALIETLRLGIDVHLGRFALTREDDEFVVAVEYLDDASAEEALYTVRDWFRAMNDGQAFPMARRVRELQDVFDRSLFGGPTIYSLIEAGLKRGIPVTHLVAENCFQWGYGARGVRGRSTIFHTDSIRDVEFTTYKDRVKEFLEYCGFPVPKGATVYSARECADEAERIGFPVVVKPVRGHKGKGVSTDLQSAEDVMRAYTELEKMAAESEDDLGDILVEQQIRGTDYRLLAVDGRFAAALYRQPAYVEGDGRSTIAELIEIENTSEARKDTIRSPLCRIKVDEQVHEYLALQNLTVQSVLNPGERVYLRRVANVSAGGLSINVTDKLHPVNRQLVEDIGRFFKVTCFAIDVIAEDISRPWNEGNFAIIEVNAGPGIFMHIAPAVGEPIDVPGMVMTALFGEGLRSRIPLIVGNALTQAQADAIATALRPCLEAATGSTRRATIASLTEAGIAFDGRPFAHHKRHTRNVEIILRHPDVCAAILRHAKDDLFDEGTLHQGADVVILEDPHYAEETLGRDLLPGGLLMERRERVATLRRDGKLMAECTLEGEDLSAAFTALAIQWLTPHWPDVVRRHF